jgi:hypothetical protein
MMPLTVIVDTACPAFNKNYTGDELNVPHPVLSVFCWVHPHLSSLPMQTSSPHIWGKTSGYISLLVLCLKGTKKLLNLRGLTWTRFCW